MTLPVIAYTPNFITLATRAYRLITGEGTAVNGGAISNDQATQALVAGNLMLKSWQTAGVNLFRRTQQTLNLTSGQGTPALLYPFAPNVISVLEARAVITPMPNLYERPMAPYTYIKYMQLPNKYFATQSAPTVWMYDRQQGGSNLYVFPPPANGCQINATVGRIANTIVNLTDDVDLPDEWLETFLYNLADRLMDDDALADAAMAANTMQRIRARAGELKREVLDFDRPDSLFMEPFGKSGRAGRRRS